MAGPDKGYDKGEWYDKRMCYEGVLIGRMIRCVNIMR